MKKVYLMVFDRDPTYNYELLHNVIKMDPYIYDWWHYLQSTYILVSTLTADALADRLMLSFKNQRFLLVEINSKNYQGWLPKDAWEWIRKYL